jgi:cold shock CspA family protein
MINNAHKLWANKSNKKWIANIENKQTKMKEQNYIGKIINLNFEKGFGFIKAENTCKNVYFKIPSCQFTPKLNDLVTYIIKATEKGFNTTAIRKIYTNEHNIKFIPRINQQHVHLELDEYLPLIIDNIKDYNNDYLEVEYELPEIVGYSDCLETNNNDEIIYAKRKGRLDYTRFVHGKSPEPSKNIFASFKKTELGYLIITIFVGKKAAREPWDALATIDDFKFWQTHALVFRPETIIKGSELKTCPWVNN